MSACRAGHIDSALIARAMRDQIGRLGIEDRGGVDDRRIDEAVIFSRVPARDDQPGVRLEVFRAFIVCIFCHA
jgi:hypothetical protein